MNEGGAKGRGLGLIVCSVLLLCGCPIRLRDGADPGGPPDAGRDVAGDAPDIEAAVPGLRIISPVNGSLVHDVVQVELDFSDAPDPGAISLIVDGSISSMVNTPYLWDTRGLPDGTHQIVVRATLDGRDVASEPVTAFVDNTPPTVVARAPEPGATNVDLSDSIQITFSEALDPGTVPGDAVSLVASDGPVPSTATLSADGKTITIALGSPFVTLPETITVGLLGTIQDLAGNQIGLVPTWSWTIPLWVEYPSQPGTSPSVALKADGHAVMSFLTASSAPTGLVVVSTTPGSGVDVGIPPPPAMSAVNAAKVAVDPTGAPIIAWSEDHVYTARWSGSTWDNLDGAADTNLDFVGPDGTPSSFILSSLILDTVGVSTLAWGAVYAGTSFGFVTTLSGSAWQFLPQPNVESGPGASVLALESTGTIWGLFPGRRDVPAVLQVYDAGQWIGISIASFTSVITNRIFPTLVLDAQDRPVILIADSSTPTIHLWTSEAGVWTEQWPSISVGGSGEIDDAIVALDPNGTPVVLWSQRNGAAIENLYVARLSGTTWDTSFGSVNGIPGANVDANSGSHGLAVDRLGRPTVVWDELDLATNTFSVYLWKSNH